MRLVALLGTSPGTVHTTLCKLQERGIKVDEVLIYATLPHAAEEALRILHSCPCPSTGKPPLSRTQHVETRTLGFNDVRSPEDLEKLRLALRPALRGGAVLDVTGGRKAMAIAAALEGYRSGATVVATVIPQEEYKRIQLATGPCDKTARDAVLLLL